MSRITINNGLVLLALSVILLTGCRKEYTQKKLGPDSTQGREIRSMIDTLRGAGLDGLDKTMQSQAADELNDRQLSALRAMLDEIIQADTVELKQVDRFGENVYRASLLLSFSSETKTLSALLVEKNDHLRWAGPN